MGYGIYRIEKRTKNAVGGIKKENNRDKKDLEKYQELHPGKIYLPNSDIDWNKTKNNYYFKKDDSWYTTIKKEVDRLELKRAPRKDAIVLLDHFVGISPEDSDRMTDKELNKYFSDAYKAIEERYGHVVNAVVHLDEKTPHMHVVTVPITEDGRLSAKDLTSGSMGFRQTQDWFYREVARKYMLKRGKPKAETDREHKTKAEHELDQLNKAIAEAKDTLQGINQEIEIVQRQFDEGILDLDSLTEQKHEKKVSIAELQVEESKLLNGNNKLRKERETLQEQIADFQTILTKAKDMFSRAVDFFFKRNFELADKWVDLTVEQTHKSTEVKLDEPLKSEANETVEAAAEEIKNEIRRKRKSR